MFIRALLDRRREEHHDRVEHGAVDGGEALRHVGELLDLSTIDRLQLGLLRRVALVVADLVVDAVDAEEAVVSTRAAAAV